MNHPFMIHLAQQVKHGRFKRAGQLLYQTVLNLAYRVSSPEGIQVMGQQWDYLVILDACRYDTFRELNTIPGRLKKAISLGSSTPEWVRKNFLGFYNVVYISANPHVSNVEVRGFKGSDHFLKVEDVWDFGWDEELNTVPPWEVTSSALRAKEKYPGKRMIIHYMQPHAPWIGTTRLSGKELGLSYSTAAQWVVKGGIWEKVEDMGISLDLVREAYSANLRLVLDEVSRLVKGLDGRIVVSADHGECLGEKFLIEHPEGIYVKELVEVPWLIIQKPKDRKKNEKGRVRRIVTELKAKGRI